MNTIFIKNMVCDRCKRVVKEELLKIGVNVSSIALGKVEVEQNPGPYHEKIKSILNQNGFELIEDEDKLLVENIKLFLLSLSKNLPLQRKEKISTLLSKKLNKDYSGLSKLFSKNEHITIEKFFLKLKLERVKELIQQNRLTFSEIAYLLDYANSNHLSKQFKDATGMNMTAYKKSNKWDRRPLDKII